jgi:tetratricopeptide (TPR) repeat protein
MKCIPFLISLCFGVYVFAQNPDAALQSKLDIFNSKVQQTEKGERLRWMDSLTTTIYDTNFYSNPKFKYDSIAKQTIKHAIALDSVSKAAEHVANLIWYKNAIVREPNEGILLFNTYINDFKTINSNHTLARLYLYLGESYKMIGNVDKTLACYSKVKDYSLKSGNDNYLGLANLYMGQQQGRIGKFSQASLSYKSAIGLFIKIKDTFQIISTKNSLANLYSQNVFHEEAIKERDETIELSKKFSKSRNLPLFYSNISEDYNQLGNRVKQIEYLKASLHALENNSKDRYWSIDKIKYLTGLTNALVDSDSLDLAEQNFKVLEALYIKDENPRSRRDYVNAKKTLTYAQGNYKEALKYSRAYLEIQKERKSIYGIMNAEQSLSEVYSALGETTNSNIHLLNHYQIKDSISGVQNAKSLAYYQTLYETEKRDLKIGNQKASIGLLNLQNKNKTQLLIFGSLGLLVLFGAIMFYRSFVNTKKRAIAQQIFSQELIKTQEQERTRIAKDLHDGVGQQITLLKMKAQNTKQTELSSLAHTALEEVRSISRDLYPVTLAKLGLTDSIEQLLLELDEETDMFVSVEIDDVNTNFDETESLNFYRFIQESVNNVLKHAKAKTLIVNILKQSDGIKILIKDNGEGFEVSDKITQNSLGLKTMAERIAMLKGSFAIKSKRAEGTSILVQIPV